MDILAKILKLVIGVPIVFAIMVLAIVIEIIIFIVFIPVTIILGALGMIDGGGFHINIGKKSAGGN